MTYGIDHTILVLEGRIRDNNYQIDRMENLCKVSLQRINDSTNGPEIDKLRADIAVFRYQIKEHVDDNQEIMQELRRLKQMSGA